MPTELVWVLSPAPKAPTPYHALPYGPKALALAHPNEVALPFDAEQDALQDPDAGAPFILSDMPLVYEAALIYRDRAPPSGFGDHIDLRNSQHINDLEWWIGHRTHRPRTPNEARAERAETDQERDWRICWEVASALCAGIIDKTIKPVRLAHTRQNHLIPLACTINISDLLRLARSRGDAGEIVSSLVSWMDFLPPGDGVAPGGETVADVVPAKGAQPRRRPRDPQDEALISEGCEMVKRGQARSANGAAKIIAKRVGGHSEDATRDRLARYIRTRLKSPSNPHLPITSPQHPHRSPQ
jgi:hypothetical protein